MWSIQPNLEIKLDEVRCGSGEWNSCSFTFSHDCGHNEDVFLTCEDSGESSFRYSSSSYVEILVSAIDLRTGEEES